ASSEQLRIIIERSNRMKFKIAIDDYGTGYSNISNLLTFMPHCVKIDRSLIMNIQDDKRKQHFTRNIIEYGHDNNFKVLAEGVETSEELATVISMGVDLIQGYYTAKPSFELVEEIAPDVSEEIVRIFSSSSNCSQNTYFTGDETETVLKSLELENYSDIFVSSGEYTIHGGNNYTSELVITVKDGIKCTLNLDNVNLRNENGDPCIKLGRGSMLTLNIIGDVSIYGSILVPETADLKIIGGGTFSVIQKSGQKFAIGNDLSHSFGNIGIYLENRFDIKVGAEQCVAIGGGINNGSSLIDIRVKEMSLDVSGKQVLGIGCFYSLSKVNISSSLISVRMLSAAGIAIGGYGRGMSTDISGSSVTIKAEGHNVSGIYSAYAEDGNIRISDSDVVLKFNGENIHAVGFENGHGKISAEGCSCDVHLEGGNSFAVGSKDKNAEIELKKCKGQVFISSANSHKLSAEESMIVITDCDFTQNEVI
ncbi:MAG: EAL domain-containing protein, partial [Huintestinicola sp.]